MHNNNITMHPNTDNMDSIMECTHDIIINMQRNKTSWATKGKRGTYSLFEPYGMQTLINMFSLLLDCLLLSLLACLLDC